jgi:putative ABC transport system ATP-binding protein
MAIFQRLNGAGLTVVMITHEPDIARFAGRIIAFRDGVIRKDERVLDRPRACDLLRDMPRSDE